MGLEPLEVGSRLSRWCRRSVSLLARQAQCGNLRTTKAIGAGTELIRMPGLWGWELVSRMELRRAFISQPVFPRS